MHRVALVDDDEDTRELLTASINRNRGLKVIRTYPTAEEALQNLPAARPDVVLMDINLPRMDGIQCVRALRSFHPPLPFRILMLTGHEDDALLFNALKAGAYGYLLKDHTSSKELNAAIFEVLRGGSPFSPGLARKIVEHFHALGTVGGPARATPSPTGLSVREQQFLELLVRGLMYKQIAERLDVSINGVRKHLQSIYRKLHVSSRSKAMLRHLGGPKPGRPPYYMKM